MPCHAELHVAWKMHHSVCVDDCGRHTAAAAAALLWLRRTGEPPMHARL